MAIASYTRTPNGFLIFCGALFGLLLIATIFVASIAAGPRPSDLDQKRADARIAVREKLEKEAADALTTEGWVDKPNGVVRVPVASVFNLTAAELAGKKATRSSVKVDAPIPAPAVDPTSTEPPTPAMTSAPQGADNLHFPLPEGTTPAPPAPAAPAPGAAPAPATSPAPQTPASAPPAKPASVPAAPAPAPAAAPTLATPTPTAPPAPVPTPAAPAAAAPEPARPPLINRTEPQ